MKSAKQRVMVVAAHPDDEVLGCGGTMAKHAARGDKVHVVILGEGITSRVEERNPIADARALANLQKDVIRAAKILGATVETHSLPDNRFDSMDLLDIIKIIEIAKRKFKPSTIYTHYRGDLNIDHRLTFQATVTACRPLKNETVQRIFSFEVPSATEWGAPLEDGPFAPKHFVDIARTLSKKLKAMAAYKSEAATFPHPRSPKGLETLARHRGMQAGLQAAEAFQLVRQIQK